MKQTTRIAIAGLLSAAGSALQAIANEMNGNTPAEQPEMTAGTTTEPTVPQKRTRKSNPAPEQAPVATSEPEKPEARPETPAPVADPTPAPEEKKEEGESAEDNAVRYERNRALIEPLVKGGKGALVKSTIAKYSSNGLRELPLKDQEAFQTDIEGLSM